MKAFFRYAIYVIFSLCVVTTSCTYNYDPETLEETDDPIVKNAFKQRQSLVKNNGGNLNNVEVLKKQIDSSHFILRSQMLAMQDSASTFQQINAMNIKNIAGQLNHLTRIIYFLIAVVLGLGAFILYNAINQKRRLRMQAKNTYKASEKNASGTLVSQEKV